MSTMSESVVRYNYRLRPGAHAERMLVAEWDRCRAIWNQAVAMLDSDSAWATDQMLTEWRSKSEWMREGSVVAQQQMLRNFRAKRAKGKGRRKFKADKKCLPSLDYTQRGFSIRDGALRLPGKVSVPVVWSRELPSVPTSARVYRDSLGHWYVSFVVRRTDEPLPAVDRSIGIDWGVSQIATTTDPAYDLPCPEFGKRNAAALKAAQRTMARRKPKPGQKASAGYREAKKAVARLHKKVARQRQDTARKWATKVVRDHGGVAVEDFKSGFLAKSTMARKAADNAVATTKATLVEYATRAGREVVLVQPAYTTMTCSECGARAKQRLLLGDRTFVCHACGHIANRDRNAAWVIHDAAGFNRASAEAVRHRVPPSRGSTLAELGIPRL